ncbi:MAG TPA: hypothetical protein VNG31_10050, partial [Candidatus Baltobacteraceae bacterium]|nr:hypothetical protein [Candidatus Baltobacteraceae bacterium]
MSTVELAIDGELPAQPLGGLLRENVEADGIRVLLFSDAPQGLAAAQLLRSHAPRLRIGIDRPGRAALPLLDAANDGQTLVTKDIAATMLAEPGVAVCDLGIHRLEGVPSQRIVQLDFGSRCATFPSLRTLESVSHNLPASIKPLFGRRRELHEIVDALGTSRMVTLTGPGGIGKSRLLVATAARVARDFCDGVRLVYLADAFDLPAIVSTVGRAFEIGGVTDVYELIERSQLAIRSILLALDNCEHVVEACSALGRVLLERCPHVAIVASSREPLRIEGEAIYRVTPLDADSALSLFVNRMRNAGERAPTDPGDLQAIASVCEAVDRLPLAIECAAGGVVSLTLPQLAAPSLADRLGALRNRVTSDPRHLSLNATIDWSYTALTPRQRDAFLALALFAEPATLDAVVAVSGTTRDDVETLVHTSMAVAHEDTEKRFGMLETMRRFAFDRLEASASANALYDRYVERHRAAVPADYEPLPSETRNFEAALRYAVARNHTGAMLPLAFQLARTWLLQGTPLPAQATLAPLVVDDRLAAVDAALFARLLNTMAALASHVNDENRAASYAMRGLELRRRTNDPRLSESFVALGNLAMHRNELHEARRLFEEALRYEQGESTVQAANAMWNLAIVALGEHEFKTAERFMLDARKRFAAT